MRIVVPLLRVRDTEVPLADVEHEVIVDEDEITGAAAPAAGTTEGDEEETVIL
jgi:hypothetical protein